MTPRRSVRLYRLLRLVADKPVARPTLLKRLKFDLRSFYRDLEFLRGHGIRIDMADGKYGLAGDLAAALDRLPFPDPRLTFGEALLLSKGRTAAHQRLRMLLDGLD